MSYCQGNIIKTNRPYLAINGDGYFAVCNKSLVIKGSSNCKDISLTRNGNFTPTLHALSNNDKQLLMGHFYKNPEYMSKPLCNSSKNNICATPDTIFKPELEILNIGLNNNIILPTQKIILTPNLPPKICHKPSCYQLYYNQSAIENKTAINNIANYKQQLEVVDNIGDQHFLEVSYLKIGESKWLAEISCGVNSCKELANDQDTSIFARGVVRFNKDGQLSDYDSALYNINIKWQNGGYNAVNVYFCGTGIFHNKCITSLNSMLFGMSNKGYKINATHHAYQYVTKDDVEVDGAKIIAARHEYYIDELGYLYITPYHTKDKKIKYAYISLQSKTSESVRLHFNNYETIVDPEGDCSKAPRFDYYNADLYNNKVTHNHITLANGFLAARCKGHSEILLFKSFNIDDMLTLSSKDNCRLLGVDAEDISGELSIDDLLLFDVRQYRQHITNTKKITLPKFQLNINNTNQTDFELPQNITSIIHNKKHGMHYVDVNFKYNATSKDLISYICINNYQESSVVCNNGTVMVNSEGKLVDISEELKNITIGSSNIKFNWPSEVLISDYKGKVYNAVHDGALQNTLPQFSLSPENLCLKAHYQRATEEVFCLAILQFDYPDEIRKYQSLDYYEYNENAGDILVSFYNEDL